MTQREQVLEHLHKYGSISQLEARHVYRIQRLASRIDELRQDGFQIETYRKKDARGERYAEYALSPYTPPGALHYRG